MLDEIQRQIKINEGVIAKVDSKITDLCNKKGTRDFDNNAYWYWLGVRFAVKSELSDLKQLQEKAEQEVSSIDHCLDALRGL